VAWLPAVNKREWRCFGRCQIKCADLLAVHVDEVKTQISMGLYSDVLMDDVLEVIDDVFHNIVGEAAAAIKGENDYFKRMEIRGRVFHENYTQYNEILNQLRAEMASDDQWPEEKIKKIYHGLTKPVIREIETAIQEGIINKVDPDLLAYALTGLIEIMSLRLSLDRIYTLQDVINFILDFMTVRLATV
jgi:hypothetical protein